ncbi:hypothetical protein SAMN05192574_10712 [Mucilaginibacter gossypiicola]|uniref:Uncharacterized protein n=1 Tax=Mucilaginibacter gossypiicola TaxID=551995 RepID=A0A1H8NMH5_9SPHI|nr:hypothetical protein [Mucilaginibacter gossypiicola]SEO30804.1 hypothetical protein SAMN05192574_10712 [Mucilaginibacter gossypiicola]
MNTTNNIKKEGSKADTTKTGAQKAKEIKTEGPLSEKDEVKQAEERTRKGTKK